MIAVSDDRLRQQKAGGELLVMTRRSHGGSDGFVANSNLQRLFNSQLVAVVFEAAVVATPYNLTWPDPVRFHRFEPDDIICRVEICHLYISTGHNFFGHHGREPDNFPMIEVPTIECVAGRGLRGDRFFDHKQDYKGQITFFSLDVFDELCGTFQLQAADPSCVRRNVFVRGINLNELIGKDFEVQGVRFHGTEESRPCHWMNGAVNPGTQEFLRGRGGLRARILTDGILKSPKFGQNPHLNPLPQGDEAAQQQVRVK